MQEQDWGLDPCAVGGGGGNIAVDVIGPKAMIARGMEICDRIMQLLVRVDEGIYYNQDETLV